MQRHPTHGSPVLARHGWIGLLLVAVAWPLNWGLDGLRTHLFFFPLWLGYTLVVDALVLRRRGTSLLTRSRREFALLFVLSVPVWWFFEVANWYTQNWQYLARDRFGDVEYFLLASLAFSTVMPAVFESAELARSFRWVDGLGRGPRIPRSRRTTQQLAATGVVMLALVALWPRIYYPFIWAIPYCLVEAANIRLGRRSLLEPLDRGDWRPVVGLTVGVMICAFFWEMWNYYAYPKWIYDTPGVAFLYVFEMPLLGYIGYPPFAMALLAILHLARGRRRVVLL